MLAMLMYTFSVFTKVTVFPLLKVSDLERDDAVPLKRVGVDETGT